MFRVILLNLLTLFGFINSPVNDLHKKPTREDYKKELNYWIQRNFYIICLAAISIALIIFVGVCFFVCGISAVESGAMRNFIGGI